MVYFIAFKVQPKPEIIDIQAKFRHYSGELTSPEMLHLTLLFLGEQCDISRVKKAIDSIKGTSIETEFANLAIIKDMRYKNAIVLAGKETGMQKIHEQLKTVLGSASSFEYMPHITLLRTNDEVKLPLIKPLKFKLSRIALIKAEKIDDAVVYNEIYSRSLDKFEDTVYKIIEDLKGLRKIAGIDVAVLYGSTAAGMIKPHMHDIDVYLLSKKPVISLEAVKRVKAELQRVSQKYTTAKLGVNFWAVGLGKVLESHKSKKIKDNIGIEIFFVPRILEDVLTAKDIKERNLKVLFGDVSFLKKVASRKLAPNTVELAMSRYLATIAEKHDVDPSDYFNYLVFSYLQDKGIFVKSKVEALQVIKKKFHTSIKPTHAGIIQLYKKINGIEKRQKHRLVEYPEFVLKGKRNFILFENINRPCYKKEKSDYLRHGYHMPNLIFLAKKPKTLRDILIYPGLQKDFEKNCSMLAQLIDPSKKIDKWDTLYFMPFSIRTADVTLKPLYTNFDIHKNRFIFWYASLATIFQTAFGYLMSKGIFETEPEKIAKQMERFGFENFGWKFILDKILSQNVEDVEKLYTMACIFIDKLAVKILAGD
jgi:2'-5' RNA ligase